MRCLESDDSGDGAVVCCGVVWCGAVMLCGDVAVLLSVLCARRVRRVPHAPSGRQNPELQAAYARSTCMHTAWTNFTPITLQCIWRPLSSLGGTPVLSAT